MRNNPQYKHDCNRCVFLGRFKAVDLYFCNQGGSIPTVIARYSSEGPDYTSGIWESTSNPDLTEGRARATARGLLGDCPVLLGRQTFRGMLRGFFIRAKRFTSTHLW
jgi:hypothetical protein